MMNKIVVEVKAISIRDLAKLSAMHTLSKQDLIDQADTQLLNLSSGWNRAISTKSWTMTGFPKDWDYTVLMNPSDDIMILMSYEEFKKLVLR